MVLFGSLTKVQIVWDLADVMMALMAIVNLVAITLLGKFAFRALDDYTMQRKAGIKTRRMQESTYKRMQQAFGGQESISCRKKEVFL